MLAGLVVQALGLVVFARHPSPVVNMILNFAIGVGQGCVEVVTNFGVIRMEREGESRLMNLAHAAFCVGGVVGPLAVGAYLRLFEQWGGGWRLVYPVSGVLVLAAIVMFSSVRFPAEPGADAQGGQGQRAGGGRARVFTPLLGILTVMLFLYVSAEIGFSNWASEYFVEVAGATASLGALMVATLWLGVLAGRLGLSLWFTSDRQDLAILALSLLSGASVLLLRASRGIPLAAIAVFLTGLGYSGVYPMVMALVGRLFQTGRAVGIASTGGGVGSFAFPLVMGYLSERVGIGRAFFLCAVESGLLALLAIAVMAMRPRSSDPTAAARGGRNTE
jgi:fucose permease